MLTLAAAHSSSNAAVWGVALIAFGILHLAFREFYARRGQAIHDARQATAPGATQRFYRSHSDGWYLRSQYWMSAIFIVAGIIALVA